MGVQADSRAAMHTTDALKKCLVPTRAESKGPRRCIGSRNTSQHPVVTCHIGDASFSPSLTRDPSVVLSGVGFMPMRLTAVRVSGGAACLICDQLASYRSHRAPYRYLTGSEHAFRPMFMRVLTALTGPAHQGGVSGRSCPLLVVVVVLVLDLPLAPTRTYLHQVAPTCRKKIFLHAHLGSPTRPTHVPRGFPPITGSQTATAPPGGRSKRWPDRPRGTRRGHPESSAQSCPLTGRDLRERSAIR